MDQMSRSSRVPKGHTMSTTLRSVDVMKRIELLQLKRQLEVLATFVPNEILMYRHAKQQRSFIGVLLFADVSGFTPLTEKYNKTGKGGIYRLTATLNAYIGAIVEVIHLFGGDILKFSGDAFLALWKVKQGQPAYDILHVVVVCALVIQKNLGVFETEVNVMLKVKLAISCGNMTFARIGSGGTKNFVVLGQAIFDVKNAEHVSVSGDIVISPAAWSHMLHDRYVTTQAEDGNVKVWKTIYRKNEDQKRIYFDERSAEVLLEVAKHLNHRKKVHVKKSFESNSSMTKVTELFLKSLPKREQVKRVPRYWSIDKLRPYIIKPVQDQVDESQPVEYLTEMREVTIQFINIVPISKEIDLMIEMCHNTYKFVCQIVGESLGVVNKVSLFDKDFMILVLFGLRGIRHEMESQHALRAGYQIRKVITQNVSNVETCSVGITQGLVYCGVVGHPFRREYTVIGAEVNKAARIMIAYPSKVICDYKTFKNSQLASFYFRLQSIIKLKGIEDAGSIYEYNESFDDYDIQRRQKLTIFGRAKEYKMIRSIIYNEFTGEMKKYNGICFHGPRKIGKTSILLQSLRALRRAGEAPMAISMELNSYSFVPFSTVSKLYEKLYDRLGTLKQHATLMPVLPRQLFKPDLEMSFPRGDVGLFKYNILNTFRKLVEVNSEVGTVFFIDNIEYVDFQSWEILEIVFEEGLIKLFTTACLEESMWNIQDHINALGTMLLSDVFTISPKYISALACMFVEAVGLPNHLEYLLIHSCDGRPGFVQSCILRLINNGSLQLKLINKSEKDSTRFIFPPEVNVELADIVAIVEFSERYRNIGQELTLQAISMDLFDSFTPYQQLVIKTASVIGDMFNRSLLVVAMQYPPEEQLAKVVMQLFEEEVFECGAKYINGSDLDSGSASKFCCRCCFKLTREEELGRQFPNYAYCKIIHFKNKSIRDVAYELLPGNQKKELHLLCTEVLESTRHTCPICTNQPILYVIYTCPYRVVMEFCYNPKKQYQRWKLPAGDHGDMKKVIRSSILGDRPETLPNDSYSRPVRDARCCSCFDIWLSVYQKLKFHAEQGKHTGKTVYYTMRYAYMLLTVRDYMNAIRYFRETVELCLVDAHETKQDPILARFKVIIMGRTQIGLAQAHLALGQLHIAKSHIVIAMRQYNIPTLAMEYRVFNELLKRTFVVNIRRIYAKAYCNIIVRFDCGNALAHCAKIFTLEGRWSLAKSAALHSLYCLKGITPNVALLHEVYCNIIEIYSFADKRSELEKLQKYVFQEVAYNFTSPEVMHIKPMLALMETLLESHFVCGHMIEGIRLGYKILDICIRLDFFMYESRLFFHLPLLLIYNGRIRDAGDVMQIFKKRMDCTSSTLPFYYIITFIVFLSTGFTIEKMESLINFASQLKRIKGKPKRLFEFIYTLVQLHYFRLGKFYKSEEWKGDNIWNPKEIKSSVPMCELTFMLQCKLVQYVYTYYHKSATAEVEAKRINKLMGLLRESCKQYTIFLPMYYYLKAWFSRIEGHKKKSRKFLNYTRKEAARQHNTLMECQVIAATNAWTGGYSIKYERRPLIMYLDADNYSLREFAQFLPVDNFE